MQQKLFTYLLLFLSKIFLRFFILTILFFSEYNGSVQKTSCNKSRQFINSTWGIISNSATGSNYTENSHCEWLIKSNNKRHFITLNFLSMETECSYDYIFVYDGDTFQSPLLGSYSGKTVPQEILATSGSMLILLYSDANYVLNGFQAEFFVTKCPKNCSNHGICFKNKCICNENWSGIDCNSEICPNECGLKSGRGICLNGYCKCADGYSGQACDLSKNDSNGNRWVLLSSSENIISKRAAHSAVYLNETDSLYIFGGYDLNQVLGDLCVYNFNKSIWEDQFGNPLVNELSTFKSSFITQELSDKVEPFFSFETFWNEKFDSVKNKMPLTLNYNMSKTNSLETSSPSSFLEININDKIELMRKKASDKFYFENEHKPSDDLNSAGIHQNIYEKPTPRYGHAACKYNNGFLIYGGKTTNGELSDELWFFNITNKKWSLRAKWSKLRPPKLIRHSLTLARNDSVYLFGGSTIGGEFSFKIYSIKLDLENGQEQWNYIRPLGGKEFDVRLVAHSTVFSTQLDALVIYGGILASFARQSKLSDKMFLFKISSRYWSEVHYPRNHLSEVLIPRERAFHISVIVGNYLVIFGGYSHRHNKEEICYDNKMYLYHMGCHTWVSQDVLGVNKQTFDLKYRHLGVFSHAADVRNGNTLIIMGGYQGNVNSNLWAYVFPPTIIGKEGETFQPYQSCGRHHSLHECTSNPECGWCSSDEICYGRTIGVNCTTNLQTTRCPGLCPALTDCQSCLIYGEEMSKAFTDETFSLANKLKLGQCMWCVQNARCHHKNDNYGVCGLREDTPLQIHNWWGKHGTEIISIEECRTKDWRPGLTFVKYKQPANWSQPDSVAIVNATAVDIDVSLRDTRSEILVAGGKISARLFGFLHIPKEWSNSFETLKMCTSFSTSSLRFSRNHLSSSLELVGNSSTESISCKTAYWSSGFPVVLQPGRFLVDFELKKLISFGLGSYQHSKMVLMHKKIQEIAKIFTFEYLEPYQNGSCNKYTNCLQCLTDALCGWCDISESCVKKNENITQLCLVQGESHYLILEPSFCINCSNYVSCKHCLSNSGCEWWVEEAKCSRRGRASFAVKTSLHCPTPCYLRKNCTQCLDEKGRCVWCEAKKECFSFSVYTSEYQFGLCREWVDQNYSALYQSPFFYDRTNISKSSDQCKSCPKHLNCSSCLKTLSCGWCYDINNPIVGVCILGDFIKPESTNCINALKNVYHKTFINEGIGWSYASCPDVNECELQLDDCHPQAICTNTYGSFDCKCKKGFYGDGRNNCTKTCYNECIHGICTMAPDFVCKCDLGWTGENCGINCGCNNHSTCKKKIGLCDECEEWTTGEFCQYCKAGSFGNATSEQKCRKCECNGHGDPSFGYCNSKTGVCFCKDNTEGLNCEKCKKGYYGNPKNGGVCFYECVARGLVSKFQFQGLGSYRESVTPWNSRLEGTIPKECVWILNATQILNNTFPNVIHLTIDGNIDVNCEDNAVFVYDGIPNFASTKYQNHALGMFCHRNDKSSLTVETKSGVMTVFFKQGKNPEGFNASYNIFSCPDNCFFNRICIKNKCVCKENWTGANCSLPTCFNNCSFNIKQGICDKRYGRCICKPGYEGLDCSEKIRGYQIIFTELFNSEKISEDFDHLRKMIPRFGHSLVADMTGSLWMFGGYSLSYGPLNDIRLFDTKNNTWIQVTVDSTSDVSMPQGRYFHAAEIVHSRREIYVFGGIGFRDNLNVKQVNNTFRDFWKFSIKHQRWIEIETIIAPPPVAGHTLTLMKDFESESLFLIGGFSPHIGFIKEIWYFNLENKEWNILKTFGKGPHGIYGHSSVYHAPTKSFYIYGGYVLSGNKTLYSHQLYSFHISTMSWFPLPTFEDYNPMAANFPQARFLHSAITTKQYMLVFGGKAFFENSEIQSSDLLMAYSYSCNQWIRLQQKGSPIIGSIPIFRFSQAMTYDQETEAVYVIGGFDNIVQGDVIRIQLPSDLCNLWQGKEKCRSHLGCSFCSVLKPDKSSSSFCYSSLRPLRESCDYYNGTLTTNNGVVCDNKWFQHRSCTHFKTCAECLTKWPAYSNELPVCKWCRNCSKERCVNLNQICKIDEKCESIINVEQCSDSICPAANCLNCEKMKSCKWISETCVVKHSNTTTLSSCSPSCSNFKECLSCLSHQCRWSTNLKECIAPDFQPLLCSGGVCGLVLKEQDKDQCPLPCSTHKQCATCLKNSQCGWCSLSNGTYVGEGICLEGTLSHPTENGNIRTCEELLFLNKSTKPFYKSINWNFITCPKENECTNGHHTCNLVFEICEDLPEGFQCLCNTGYKSSQSQCEPICSKGCFQGKCVQPDLCVCDFGYVGVNCSIQCQCNGHSNCASPEKLNECLKCHNNTQGPQCDRCKPLFVGDPRNNGTCVPCFEYCHHHTNICINDSSKQLFLNKSVIELIAVLKEGPLTDALCIGCTNKTKGKRCEECLEGYFRGTEDLNHHCRPCECHGHGDRCDPLTGEKCNCANNTESECQTSISKNSNQQCWMLQCSKCKETYSGTPTEGHQCYKQMSLDNKFCLNSKVIEECKLKPKPLLPGQSAFFQVQPRYVNVNIRVFIDVMQGSLDLYMSVKDDSLVVQTNYSTGLHFLEWDSKYKKKSAWFDQSSTILPLDPKLTSTKSLTLDGNWSTYDLASDSFFGVEKEAEGLTTYITVDKKNIFLKVKNIRGRLILTLLKDSFDLISTKFYLGLVASSQGETTTPSHGILFFRQDQLHIDLFVFFSVFFSCFFLFIAGCVIAWKAKQAADIRRARRRHVVEMLHMAKRPFAKLILVLDTNENQGSSVSHVQSPLKWKKKKYSFSHQGINPLAIEPTEDGIAAVATFFVTLPGGSEAPVRLCLASSLIIVCRLYHLNSRVFSRRRSSHHGLT